jgi:hypothetical protein
MTANALCCGIIADMLWSCGMTVDMSRLCSVMADALWLCGMVVVIAVVWHDSRCDVVVQCNSGHITVVA